MAMAKGSFFQPGRRGLQCAAGLFSLANVTLFAWWFQGTRKDGSSCWARDRLEALFAIARVLLSGALGTWLSCKASSALLRMTTIFIFTVWFQALLSLAHVVTPCGLPGLYTPTVATVRQTGQEANVMQYYVLTITISGFAATIVLNLHLLQMRLMTAERTALLPARQGFVGAVNCIIVLCMLLHFTVSVVFLAGRPEGSLEPIYGGRSDGSGPSVWARVCGQVQVALVGLVCFCWLSKVGHVYHGLFRVLVLAWRAAATKSMDTRAINAYWQLVREVLLFTASLLSSMLQAVVQGVLWQNAWLLRSVLVGLEALFNMLLAIYVSGTFSGAVQGTSHRAWQARQRLQRRRKALLNWRRRPGLQDEEDFGWQAAVHDLALRGVSLRALLHFYKVELPRWMAFEASRHSTADVVFQCVLPMTREKGCHAAELLMEGRRVRPDKMVTHDWSNSFRDLIAALCADAFGECEYWAYSRLLDEDVETLEKWVEFKGLGDQVYWICCFSVNQHKGICQQAYRDCGTRMPMPPCSCRVTKAFNTTAPCLPDGRSVRCEMNKFVEMMQYLADRDSGFSQVLAVDATFRTFSRAWCVAELAMANELGMVQDVKIRSTQCLEERRYKLNDLRIQDMEATRLADKQHILDSIPDHEAFNEALRTLIFDDLLPRWTSLDAQERMVTVGNIIRWQGTKIWLETPGELPKFNPYRVSV